MPLLGISAARLDTWTMQDPGNGARARRAADSARQAAKAAAEAAIAARRATKSFVSASQSAARASAAAANGASRTLHRITSASGAGRTGLAHLIELSAAGSVGDGFVAVALAGTLFFSSSPTQARGRVALALIITIAPFALLAPFVGPALDRVRQGRGYILVGTMLARGLLCWGMAGAVQHNDTVTLLPAAFGILVLQKAFGVTRAAVTPRLLPREITLVTANARCALASLIATTVAVPVAAGIDTLLGGHSSGAAWVLRVGTVVYLGAMVPGLRLPRGVDEPAGEPGDGKATSAQAATAAVRPGPPRRRRKLFPQPVGPVVEEAILTNITFRAYSGFMIFFLAFLLRAVHLGVSDKLAVAEMLVGVAIGGFVGTAIGSALRAKAPQTMMYAMLGASTIVTALCAAFFGLWAAVIVAFGAAVGQTLVKVALDSIVQQHVSSDVRPSTFAASETLHQLSWVAGGLLGLAMSLTGSGAAGLGVASACLAVVLVSLLVARRTRILRRRRSAPSGVDVVSHRA
jgi:MFS family permease